MINNRIKLYWSVSCETSALLFSFSCLWRTRMCSESQCLAHEASCVLSSWGWGSWLNLNISELEAQCTLSCGERREVQGIWQEVKELVCLMADLRVCTTAWKGGSHDRHFCLILKLCCLSPWKDLRRLIALQNLHSNSFRLRKNILIVTLHE